MQSYYAWTNYDQNLKIDTEFNNNFHKLIEFHPQHNMYHKCTQITLYHRNKINAYKRAHGTLVLIVPMVVLTKDVAT